MINENCIYTLKEIKKQVLLKHFGLVYRYPPSFCKTITINNLRSQATVLQK